ncbi:MAG: adenylate/guanylate cyclase domain-containing protein [Candidatus Limnocylindrales bacterium]
MPRLQRKSFDQPDQVRRFEHGRLELVQLDETTVGRFVNGPGWRWSTDVQPIVGTRSCQNRHVGFVISGSLQVMMDDGTELLIQAGDAYEIPPGHDAWTGDDGFDSVEFASARTFAVSPDDEAERILATILFTDIVGSTAILEERGDAMWSRLLLEHNARIRAELDRYRGREIVTTGDGFLAVFDGAARAVRAADAMTRAVRDLAIEIRAGLHTGEVELDGGQARGVAVHAAARVAALAGPGDVLVTGTTRDLLDGSGLQFESRGTAELKGLTGERAIFALAR